MKNIQLTPADDTAFPEGVLRLDYQSSVDGRVDYAYVWPGAKPDFWIVVIHGHGSHGDQLYTRPDIRDEWLPEFRKTGGGIITPNLRDNAWMSRAAAQDMHELLAWLREKYGLKQTLFCSGSMGGTSNLIYAVLHPEEVGAVIARGAASDLKSYRQWCSHQERPGVREIGEAVEAAYQSDEEYENHSTYANAHKLTMPVYLIHGGADEAIPVEQARMLAAKLKDKADFFYDEIPGGNHDSPISEKKSLKKIMNLLAHRK
jgi:pimeloyl-ACP methyl ester carboxylesterase